MTQGMRWVLDSDIKRYFDTIPHAQLRRFLDQRVTDGVVRRMIDKWLKAGCWKTAPYPTRLSNRFQFRPPFASNRDPCWGRWLELIHVMKPRGGTIA